MKRKDIGHDWLEKQYWEHGLSAQKIADLLSCSTATIFNRMEELNIQRRSRSAAAIQTWQDESRREKGSGVNSSFWRGGEIERECESCGKKFTVRPHVLKLGKGRFCSRKCHMDWRSKTLRGELSPQWKGGKVAYICEYCGRESRTWSCLVNRKRFCSRRCKGLWASENLHGENGYNWRGGSEPYPKEFNEQFKQQIRSRDNYSCAICHLPGRDVHHIDYVKDNTTPENCTVLCRHCHGTTNFHREYWQIVLEKLMKARLSLWLGPTGSAVVGIP